MNINNSIYWNVNKLKKIINNYKTKTVKTNIFLADISMNGVNEEQKYISNCLQQHDYKMIGGLVTNYPEILSVQSLKNTLNKYTFTCVQSGRFIQDYVGDVLKLYMNKKPEIKEGFGNSNTMTIIGVVLAVILLLLKFGGDIYEYMNKKKI
jgi:hypothetical protein